MEAMRAVCSFVALALASCGDGGSGYSTADDDSGATDAPTGEAATLVVHEWFHADVVDTLHGGVRESGAYWVFKVTLKNAASPHPFTSTPSYFTVLTKSGETLGAEVVLSATLALGCTGAKVPLAKPGDEETCILVFRGNGGDSPVRLTYVQPAQPDFKPPWAAIEARSGVGAEIFPWCAQLETRDRAKGTDAKCGTSMDGPSGYACQLQGKLLAACAIAGCDGPALVSANACTVLKETCVGCFDEAIAVQRCLVQAAFSNCGAPLPEDLQ